MLVTQKCQYALKALLVLAKRPPGRPVKIAQIAEEQAIPYRFLEVILGQLKQGGFVDSRRGNEGGYLLTTPPAELSVGRIVKFIDGPIFAEDLTDEAEESATPEALNLVWRRAEQAVLEVFNGTTIADLIAEEDRLRARFSPNYVI